MKANRAYELLVRRGGRGPALLRSSGRADHVEVVEIDSGEVVLFWDTTPAQTGRLSRALKADLAQLDADEFLARWRRYERSRRPTPHLERGAARRRADRTRRRSERRERPSDWLAEATSVRRRRSRAGTRPRRPAWRASLGGVRRPSGLARSSAGSASTSAWPGAPPRSRRHGHCRAALSHVPSASDLRGRPRSAPRRLPTSRRRSAPAGSATCWLRVVEVRERQRRSAAAPVEPDRVAVERLQQSPPIQSATAAATCSSRRCPRGLRNGAIVRAPSVGAA